MVNLANIAAGVSDRMDFRRGQRQQMAEAFENYRRNNPLATVADFQSFIDQMSGGNNYIAGGAPGEAVLKRIAASNAAREAERKRKAELNNFLEQQKVIETLQPRINAAILSAKPDVETKEVNLQDAYYDFMQKSQLPEDINIKDMFSPWMYDQLKSDLFAKNSQQAYEYIDRAEDPNKINIRQFATLFTDGNMSLARELKDMEVDKYNTKQEELKNQFNIDVEDYAREIAQNPYIKPESLIPTLKARFGANKFWDDLDEAGLKKIQDKMQVIYDQKAEDKRVQDNLEFKNLVDMESTQQTIIGYIRAGQRDKAIEYLKGMLPIYMKKDHGITDDLLASEVDKIQSNLQQTQQTTYTNKNAEFEGQIKGQTIQGIIDENMATATDKFSSEDSVGGNHLVQKGIYNFARKFLFDPATVSHIQTMVGMDMFKGVTNEAEVEQILMSQLAQYGATPLSEYQQNRIDAQRAQYGAVRPQTFVDYENDERKAYIKNETKLRKLVDEALQGGDATQRFNDLTKLANLWERESQGFMAQLIAEAKVSGGDTGWILAGTPQYDLNLIKDFKTSIQNVQDLLTQHIKEAKTEMDKMPKTGDEERNKPIYPDDPEKSMFFNELNKFAQSQNFAQDMWNLREKFGFRDWIGGKLTSYLFDSTKDYNIAKFINEFTNNKSVIRYFERNKTDWESFKQDPIQHVKDNPALKQFAKDLGLEIPD